MLLDTPHNSELLYKMGICSYFGSISKPFILKGRGKKWWYTIGPNKVPKPVAVEL